MLNYLWLHYLQSKLNCFAILRLSTTPLETEKYMSKLVKHNYPKAANHRNCLQKKNDYYVS